MNVIYPAIRSAVYPAVRGVLDISEKKQTSEQIIQSLFAQGQQGFWLPFTDFASLSQDAAGTLPYTALQQPVGRVLDRSGRGNHASQPTSTARGVVSARVNALLNTDNPAAWGYAGSRFSVGAKDVDGGWPLTHLLAASIAVNTDYPIGASGVSDATIVRSIELQAGTASYVTFGAASATDAVTIDLVSKVIVANVGACPVTITTLADNWIRVEFWVSRVGSFSASSLSNYMLWGVSQVVATVGSTIKVRKPSYSRQALGYTAPVPFQRVGATSTDYDAIGFPKYLKLDGTDDFYTCGGGGSTTGFYYSDVIRPTSATFSALLADNTASGGYLVQRTNNGIYFAANAGAAITSVYLLLAANAQAFVSAMDDGVNLTLQVNSAQVSVARPVVTAGSATMYLGRYTTVAQYFSGQATEPIYRAGPPPNAYEREVIRNYQMQKAGML